MEKRLLAYEIDNEALKSHWYSKPISIFYKLQLSGNN